MDIWYKTACLLILTAPSPETVDTVCQGKAHVHLEHQKLFAGSSLTLNCTVMLSKRADRFRVKWLLNQSSAEHCQGLELSTQTSVNQKQKDERPLLQMTENTHFLLTLKDVGHNMSGFYFCQITMEIPELCVLCSSGAQFIVEDNATLTTFHTAAPNVSLTVPPVRSSWRLLVPVMSGTIMMVVLVAVIWIFCKKRKCHNRNKENPIYENMHPASKYLASRRGQETNITNLPALKDKRAPKQSIPTDVKLSPKPYI